MLTGSRFFGSGPKSSAFLNASAPPVASILVHSSTNARTVLLAICGLLPSDPHVPSGTRGELCRSQTWTVEVDAIGTIAFGVAG